MGAQLYVRSSKGIEEMLDAKDLLQTYVPVEKAEENFNIPLKNVTRVGISYPHLLYALSENPGGLSFGTAVRRDQIGHFQFFGIDEIINAYELATKPANFENLLPIDIVPDLSTDPISISLYGTLLLFERIRGALASYEGEEVRSWARKNDAPLHKSMTRRKKLPKKSLLGYYDSIIKDLEESSRKAEGVLLNYAVLKQVADRFADKPLKVQRAAEKRRKASIPRNQAPEKDALSIYFKDVQKHPVVERDDQTELARQLDEDYSLLNSMMCRSEYFRNSLSGLVKRILAGHENIHNFFATGDMEDVDSQKESALHSDKVKNDLPRINNARSAEDLEEALGRFPLRKDMIYKLATQLLSEFDAYAGLIREGGTSARFQQHRLGVDPEEAMEYRKSLKTAFEKVTASRNQMVKNNLRIVILYTNIFASRGLDRNDLIQEGNIGLLRAVDHFDYTRGFTFSTYASWWVKQNIKRAIQDQDRTVRIPVHMQYLQSKVRRVAWALNGELGRQATPEEIADRIGESPKMVEKALKSFRKEVSLDMNVGEDGNLPFIELVPDTRIPTPEEQAIRNKDGAYSTKFLDRLPPKQREMLVMRYGFLDGEERTLQEVGDKFGLSRERIRQLEVKSINMMRSSWAEEEGRKHPRFKLKE